MKLDRYDIEARFIPALFGVIPILVIWFQSLKYFQELQHWVFSIKLIGGISFGLILTYAFVFLVREISKKIQSSVFKEMPSAYLMQSDKFYSDSFKTRYFDKVVKDFQLGIDLSSNESSHQLEEAFALALEKVRNRPMVRLQNIRYGFIRNILGGCLIGLVGSGILLCISVYQNNLSVIILSIVLMLVYGVPLLFTKRMLFSNGEAFSKTVYSNYMLT